VLSSRKNAGQTLDIKMTKRSSENVASSTTWETSNGSQFDSTENYEQIETEECCLGLTFPPETVKLRLYTDNIVKGG
jgi:hypothetical protein